MLFSVIREVINVVALKDTLEKITKIAVILMNVKLEISNVHLERNVSMSL